MRQVVQLKKSVVLRKSDGRAFDTSLSVSRISPTLQFDDVSLLSNRTSEQFHTNIHILHELRLVPKPQVICDRPWGDLFFFQEGMTTIAHSDSMTLGIHSFVQKRKSSVRCELRVVEIKVCTITPNSLSLECLKVFHCVG